MTLLREGSLGLCEHEKCWVKPPADGLQGQESLPYGVLTLGERKHQKQHACSKFKLDLGSVWTNKGFPDRQHQERPSQ